LPGAAEARAAVYALPVYNSKRHGMTCGCLQQSEFARKFVIGEP
jgi:hypothetical protein